MKILMECNSNVNGNVNENVLMEFKDFENVNEKVLMEFNGHVEKS